MDYRSGNLSKIGESRFAQSHIRIVVVDPEQLKGWCPVDAVIADGKPAIEWMDLRDVEFSEPFFVETLERINSDRQKVVTDFDFLLQVDKISEHVPPSGFIFHASRCGSTLLANVCKTLNSSIVVSEAPVIDKIISRFFTDAEQGSSKELLYMVLLRAAINVLGQPQRGNEGRYFIKFACTSTLQMTRIRRVWPEVPFVFLYRDPIEILVSNLRSIPEWMRPESNPGAASAIIGVGLDQLVSVDHEEFCARALGKFFEEALANRGPYTLLINYEHLSLDRLIEIMNFFKIEVSALEADAIRRVSRLYSKDVTSSQQFYRDTEAKREAASEYIQTLAAKWAFPAYQVLDSSG